MFSTSAMTPPRAFCHASIASSRSVFISICISEWYARRVQWNEVPQFLWVILAMAALVVLVAITQARRSKALTQRLELLTRELGWTEVTFTRFLTIAVQGT